MSAPVRWRQALAAVVEAAQEETGWAVTGSAALALHGRICCPATWT